jgi:AbrB family looped-hinge helix DNA binding protein
MADGIVHTVKTETIQMDKAGRVVLPKPLREQFNLLPGDKLRLSVDGKGIRLEPTDVAGTLVRKGSLLVFRGGFSEPITTAKVDQLLREDRDDKSGQTTAKIPRR